MGKSWLCRMLCDCECAEAKPVTPPPVVVQVPVLLERDFLESALKYVFVNEGDYSNVPQDRGGPTRWGITQQNLSEWLGRPVTITEVQNLPYTTAVDIYRANYWVDVGFDKIKVEALAICLFDTGVLMGPRTAINYAQVALNSCGEKLTVDGYCGPLTCEALARVDKYKFLSAYRDLLKARFDMIVANDSSQTVFYTGWMNRANRLLTLKSV